jgi:hypothetical protein
VCIHDYEILYVDFNHAIYFILFDCVCDWSYLAEPISLSITMVSKEVSVIFMTVREDGMSGSGILWTIYYNIQYAWNQKFLLNVYNPR